jgi:anhydro-N-acetylmuramic acid kinase
VSEIYVGLMSGTSLDGITAAVARFTEDRCELLGAVTCAYNEEQRSRIERAIAGPVSAAEWCRLDVDLGSWLADAALTVIDRTSIPPRDIRAIGSHGQTVWHEPARATWQIGEAAVIAERTGIDVISDFRVRDVAAGGQGAPLVTLADALLFRPAAGCRALQNLGGIGNVAVVGRGGVVVRAFDTGPGVVVIDAVVRRLAGAPYDIDGRLARQGHPIDAVVRQALTHPYFASPPPKSTGRELFTPEYVDAFIAQCAGASTPDIVATAVALTAARVADAYRRFVPEPLADVLLSGGGARNPALVDALTAALAPRVVRRFDDVFFDGEAKEAVAFAFLAYRHVHGLPGNVPSATGAAGPRILGKRTPA